MLELILMGVEITLIENSVLKMYLLNTELNVHIKSFISSFRFFLFASYTNLSEVYDK